MALSEAEFLTGYDPGAYDRPSVAVDLVLMSVIGGAPAALLVRREEPPFAGRWALPGGFVRMDEGLDEAARRVLGDKAHMAGAYVEQLYTFGAVDRDPRTRVISVAYFALLPADCFAAALKADGSLSLARIAVPRTTGDVAGEAWSEDSALPLAFDHAQVLGLAVQRLRGKIDWSPVGFALLPERFTLRALQDVHEAILGVPLNKPAFRRRMLDRGWLEPTGERETGSSFRPAELFRFRSLPISG
ncbi:8-oxo-dGTP diphosphatase [Novosphingobium sp. PhB165]|uniref:NUDIX hydrolase n=1 Tax=Novosphingobium sp. PhB165 TaxID=2485105 RepID=UPI0010D09F63|nr:NUDIX domain-containing protein [Novosphingobium sp. PhB165]TCM20496.1 8-oxo-dGTP diphosphatase [Novosphingobium sp. PhB165]